MSNTRTLELDVSKEGTGACVKVGQGDDGGTTIKALIYDNGGELSLSGYGAFLVARLPDRIHYYRGSATVSGNTITYVCDESKLASVPGYTDEAYFEIVKDDFLAQTERFALDILRSAKEGQQPAQSWDNAIDDLIRRGENAAAKSEQAVTDAGRALNNANAAVNICKSATDAAKRPRRARRTPRQRAPRMPPLQQMQPRRTPTPQPVRRMPRQTRRKHPRTARIRRQLTLVRQLRKLAAP